MTWLDAIPGPDTVRACLNDTVVIAGLSGGVNCVWTPMLDVLSTNNCTLVALPQGDRYYKLEWTDLAGCYALDSVWVDVDSVSLTGHLVTQDDSICLGDSLPLLALGGTVYAWSPSLGLSNANIANPVASPPVTTEYHVRISNGGTCVVEDSVMVEVDLVGPAGTLTTNADTICRLEPVKLIAGGGIYYLWSNGATTSSQNVMPAVTTTYTVTVSDGGTCVWVDSVQVFVDDCCWIPGVDTVLRSARMSGLVAQNGSTNIVNQHWYVLDTLYVNAYADVNATTFEMGEGAVIWVMPGVNFNTMNCLFRSACGDSVWRTVWVDGPTAGFKSVQDTFRDAETAVTSHNGGVANLEGDEFRRNYRHFLADSYTLLNGSTFSGNDFGGGSILPPFQQAPGPFCGIDLREVRGGIQVGQVASLGNSLVNTFHDMQYGIFMRNSQAYVERNVFRDLIWQGTLGPLGHGAAILVKADVWGSTLRFGRMNPAGTQPLPAAANTIQDCPEGVYVEGVQHVEVYGNTFLRIRRAGVLARQLNKNRFQVVRNTFNDVNTSVAVHLSRNLIGLISRNTVTGPVNQTRTGFFLNNVMYSPLDNAPFLVDRNIVTLRGHGIWLLASDHVDIRQNTFTMTPVLSGNAGPNHAIRLEKTDFVKIHDNELVSNASNLAANRTWMRGIWVESGTSTDVSCNVVRNFGWGIAFRSICLGSSVRYNDLYSAVDGLLLVDDALIGIQGSRYQPTGNRWMGTFTHGMTYSLRTDARLDSMYVRPNGNNAVIVTRPPFAMNALTATQAQHVRFEFPLATINQPSPCGNGGGGQPGGTTNAVAIGLSPSNSPTLWPVENRWKSEYWGLMTLMADSILLNGNVGFQAFATTMSGSPLGKIEKAERALRNGEFSQADLELSAVAPNNFVETNHVLQKNIQIRIEAFPETIDSLAVSQLRSIAILCPDIGGNAVWESRSLLATLGEIVEGYGCQYPLSKADPGPTNVDPSGLTVNVWPNPTSDVGFILVEGGNGASTVFELSDLHGRIVRMLNVSEGQISRVSLETLSSGTYLWTLYQEGSIPLRGKLVVER